MLAQGVIQKFISLLTVFRGRHTIVVPLLRFSAIVVNNGDVTNEALTTNGSFVKSRRGTGEIGTCLIQF